MNEAETRAELIDPILIKSGGGVNPDIKVFREHKITHGKIQTGGSRAKPLIADYVLAYRQFVSQHYYTLLPDNLPTLNDLKYFG